eukprot:g15089.t1
MMSTTLRLLVALPCLILGKESGTPALRGNDAACTGAGSLPQTPACYEGSLLTNSFSIKVVSVDGDVGIVDLKAVGSSSQQCDGVDFQNSAGSITVENDPGCGLSDYDYSVKYCSDQDQVASLWVCN